MSAVQRYEIYLTYFSGLLFFCPLVSLCIHLWHLQLVCEEIDGSFSWLLGHITTKKFLVSLKFPVDKLSSRGWPLVLYVVYSLAERRRQILPTFEITIKLRHISLFSLKKKNNLKSVLSYVPRTVLTVYAEKNSKHCSSDLFTKLVNLNPKGKTMAGKQIRRGYLVWDEFTASCTALQSQ